MMDILLIQHFKKISSSLLLVMCIVPFISFAQLSPGDLAEPHSHLEGLSNCTNCHTLGEKISNGKCLSCHTLLDERIKQNKGYHASSELKGKSCITCHSDHHGLKFDMLNFNEKQFDHKLTGYTLEGKHSKINCKDCHIKDFILNVEIKKKKRTYLGLNTKCLNCHNDYHQETLSNKCEQCHDLNSFKPAPLFDHQNTNYPLEGMHRDINCINCHPVLQQNGANFQKFNGISHNSCTSCHKDIHNNKFGQNCTECHTVNSFKDIAHKSSFDHNRTDYPLEGAHTKVDCKKCHKGNLTNPVNHRYCTDCHKDYHKGAFININTAISCKQCHTMNSFAGSTYSIEKHENSSFPLKGAHMATPCFICHQKNDEWVFRDLGKKCSDCHEDIHKNYISEKYYPESNCDNCHDEIRWSSIEFNHNKTEFELKGGHQKPSCRDCHFHESEEGKYVQKFLNLGKECTVCHADIHQNQFNEKYDNCSNCHNINKWKPSEFDHNKTRFVLDGKHENLACNKCHNTKENNGIKYTYYINNKIKCEDCH